MFTAEQWNKTKERLLLVIVTTLITTGTFLGFNITDFFSPVFTEHDRIIISEMVKTIEELDGDLVRVVADYRDSNITFNEIKKHLNNENVHMELSVKDQRYVSYRQYRADIKQINDNLKILIERAVRDGK